MRWGAMIRQVRAGMLSVSPWRRVPAGPLDVLVRLTTGLDAGDWQGSIRGQLQTLVDYGFGEAAALVSIGEAGEVDIWAHAGPAQPADLIAERSDRIRQLGAHGTPATDDGWVFVPLPGQAESLNALVMVGRRWQRHRNLDAPTLQFLRGTTALLALAWAAETIAHRQAALSQTDGLTGLLNHRHFQQALSLALAESYLSEVPLTLILLDIDRFKMVNDVHGHLFGDLVLKELAAAIRRHVPSSGLAARYGGEEFAIALPGFGTKEGMEVAETVRRAIAAQPVIDFTTAGGVAVSVSLGVAGYELGEGKNNLMGRADDALYESKRCGGNRSTYAGTGRKGLEAPLQRRTSS